MADSGESAELAGVEVVGDHRLRLTFIPFVVGELGFEHQEWKAGAAELADATVFAQVEVHNGALRWPNGYTMQPHELYARLKKSQKPAASTDSKDPTLVTVAGAVTSGLGVLGFTTLAGGVVLWRRFQEMGLPADHALGLVPKAELVATGAEFLIPAVLLSLLVVLIAVLISNWVKRRIDKGTFQWLVEQAWLREPRRVIAPVIIGVGGTVFSFVIGGTVSHGGLAILIGLSILGGLVVRASGRFPFAVYCLVAFLAVGTFAIARTYERTSHRLEVLPMAYSRSQPGDAPRVEVGYFVAETSDRILFASQPEGTVSSPNELREFPRAETDDLEIGELAPSEQAERDAAHFAFNLCERLALLRPLPVASAKSAKAKGKTASSTGKPPAVCERPYLKHLATTAGLTWKLDAAEKLEARLAKALAVCRKMAVRARRVSCEGRAHKQFDPKKKGRKKSKGKGRKGTRG